MRGTPNSTSTTTLFPDPTPFRSTSEEDVASRAGRHGRHLHLWHEFLFLHGLAAAERGENDHQKYAVPHAASPLPRSRLWQLARRGGNASRKIPPRSHIIGTDRRSQP